MRQGYEANLKHSNEEAKQLTQDALQTALFRLMGEKPFEDVTVTELVAVAGTSRNAFYRNYGTMGALLDALSLRIVSRLRECIPNLECADQSAFARFFRTAAEHEDDFRILVERKQPLLEKTVWPFENYTDAARQGAFAQIVMQWYDSGMKESPEEMGKLCRQLLSVWERGEQYEHSAGAAGD